MRAGATTCSGVSNEILMTSGAFWNCSGISSAISSASASRSLATGRNCTGHPLITISVSEGRISKLAQVLTYGSERSDSTRPDFEFMKTHQNVQIFGGGRFYLVHRGPRSGECITATISLTTRNRFFLQSIFSDAPAGKHREVKFISSSDREVAQRNRFLRTKLSAKRTPSQLDGKVASEIVKSALAAT